MVTAARFGHSAVLRHTPVTEHYSMLVLGGFNGQMLNSSSLEFHLGTCSALTSNVTCMAARIGVQCVWIDAQSKCVSADSAPMSDPDLTVTCRSDDDTSIVSLFRQNYEFCRSLTHCATCLSHDDCEWCDTGFCFGKDSGLCAKVTILTNSVYYLLHVRFFGFLLNTCTSYVEVTLSVDNSGRHLAGVPQRQLHGRSGPQRVY